MKACRGRIKAYLGLLLLFTVGVIGTASGEVRVIAIGAHPDDCDLGAGGTAQLLEAMGIKVKFVSITNGDAGHPTQGGGALGRRRRAEAIEAGRRIGVEEYEVLDNHDGELMPTLEIRHELIRIIRRWKADVVIGPRTSDYYCDHRYAGILVQDTSLQVVVPNICSETPPLDRNPVYLYFQDEFQQPSPFRPEVAISIDEVFQKKIFGLDSHVSQFYEWLPWLYRYTADVPKTPEARLAWLAKTQSQPITPAVRAALEHWYGAEKASHTQHAEAFEISEYGTKPTEADLRRLFPMLK
jgi:LmbE family N-acetylglucosaminyl deacetylase